MVRKQLVEAFKSNIIRNFSEEHGGLSFANCAGDITDDMIAFRQEYGNDSTPYIDKSQGLVATFRAKDGALLVLTLNDKASDAGLFMGKQGNEVAMFKNSDDFDRYFHNKGRFREKDYRYISKNGYSSSNYRDDMDRIKQTQNIYHNENIVRESIDYVIEGKLGKIVGGTALALSTLGGMQSCTPMIDQNKPTQTQRFVDDSSYVNTGNMSRDEFIQYKIKCHQNDSYSAADGEVGYCIWVGKGCAGQYKEHTWIIDVVSRDGKLTQRFILPQSMLNVCTGGKQPSSSYLPNSKVATDVIKHLEELQTFTGEVSYFQPVED